MVEPSWDGIRLLFDRILKEVDLSRAEQRSNLALVEERLRKVEGTVGILASQEGGRTEWWKIVGAAALAAFLTFIVGLMLAKAQAESPASKAALHEFMRELVHDAEIEREQEQDQQRPPRATGDHQ